MNRLIRLTLLSSDYWSYQRRAKAYRALKQYKLAQADESNAAAFGPPK